MFIHFFELVSKGQGSPIPNSLVYGIEVWNHISVGNPSIHHILDLVLVLIGDSLVKSLSSATITVFDTQTAYRIAQYVNLHSKPGEAATLETVRRMAIATS